MIQKKNQLFVKTICQDVSINKRFFIQCTKLQLLVFNMIKNLPLLVFLLGTTVCKIGLLSLSSHHQQQQKCEVIHSDSSFRLECDSRVVQVMNVPDVFQATDYTCGPASLTAVLNYFHIDRREAQLAKMAKTNQDDGTDPYDMIAVVKQLGLSGQMKEQMSIYELQSYLNQGYPVILLIQAWKDDDDPTPYSQDDQDGHYVVAIGYDADRIYFQDPWIIGSLAYLSKVEIYDRWHGDTIYPSPRTIRGCGIVVMKQSTTTPPVIHMD